MAKVAFKKRSLKFLTIRFLIYAGIVVLLYLNADLPLSYATLFVVFLVIKIFISPDKILRIMTELFPNFKNLGINSQRFIIIIFYLLILFGLKVVVIDFVFQAWLGMYPREDFSNFLEQNGVNQTNYLL